MEIKSTTIYFPINLRNEIKKLAKFENRSFNQQVISILKKAIYNPDKSKGGDKK